MTGVVRVLCAAPVAVLVALTLAASTLSMSMTSSAPRGVMGGAGYSHGFQPPLRGAVLTQSFGCSPYPFEPLEPACATRHWHSGVDLAAPAGTPVRATLGGRVRVLLSAGGFGLHVIVDHGAGLTSLYGHLSDALLPDGAAVEAGATIGDVGSTGNSTGPHLHFEIRRDGVAEDPRLDLPLP
ncbi:MAG: M23 family metallopeptidase [Candidatus Dormibacteraeota bacterium]|nr:M23 family metallopeptidase [Candidatus Dormibacteraeota bacterium]